MLLHLSVSKLVLGMCLAVCYALKVLQQIRPISFPNATDREDCQSSIQVDTMERDEWR